MNLSTIPCKKSHVFSKMQDFPQKKYSLPLKGICVSVAVCSMNLTYCIPVLNVILNTTMKPPLVAKKHVSFFCNVPLRKLYIVFSTSNTPTNHGGILDKMQHSFWKIAFFSQKIGNNPAPYVACFLTCSHCFGMQNLCQTLDQRSYVPSK